MSAGGGRRRTRLALLLTAAWLLPAAGAAAHGRSTSTSAWDIDAPQGAPASARVVVRVAWADLQRALPSLGSVPPRGLRYRRDLAREIDAYLVDHLVLLADGRPCPTGRVQEVPSPDPTHIGRRWEVHCEAPGALRLRIEPFHEVLTSHLHLARLRVGDAPAVERVFVLDSPELPLEAAGAAPPQASSFGAFVALGVEHIATGVDHLVFLLALLLAGVRVMEVATIVTGFTVAHSVTLALGVLGWVRPEPAAVEALIGLSIAVVALENTTMTVGPRTRRWLIGALCAALGAAALGNLAGHVAVPASALLGVGLFALCYFALLRRSARPFRLRWLLAFVFGLVHGFGFAGVLTEMALPPDRLASALLGFNLGVELGQLTLVVLAWPILLLLLGGPASRRTLVMQAGSAAVLAAGVFWFVSRAVM